MNIVYLTVSPIRNIAERGLYEDLVRTLVKKGHKIIIFSPLLNGESTSPICAYDNSVTIFKVPGEETISRKSILKREIESVYWCKLRNDLF